MKLLTKILLTLSLIWGLSSVSSNPKKFKIVKPEKSFIRVAVIDSGLDPLDTFVTRHLCPKDPYKDFTETGTQDEIKHGSIVLRLLTIHAGDSNFCIHVIKYYDEKSERVTNGHRFLQAMEYLNKIKPDVVNISSGGPNYSGQEFNIIKNNPKMIFFTAAGNDGVSLDEKENTYYPASYLLPNINVVGSLDEFQKKLPSSNFGSIVKFWELGRYPEGSGTSFATPVALGKYVYTITHPRIIITEQ